MKHKTNIGISEKTYLQRLLANPIFIIVSNWLFQGMRYMEAGERYLKLFFSLIVSLIIISIIMKIKGRIVYSEVIISFVVVHTLNWIFNGQLFVLMRYLPLKNDMTVDKMKSFIADIYGRTHRADYVQAVLIFGSLSRGEITSISDLDVRIIRQKGIWKTLKAYILSIRLRLLAFKKRFPLDIYTFGDISYLKRLREDEPPIIIIDNGFVEKYYKNYSFYQEALNKLKFKNE